jgi:hypothetical protein
MESLAAREEYHHQHKERKIQARSRRVPTNHEKMKVNDILGFSRLGVLGR